MVYLQPLKQQNDKELTVLRVLLSTISPKKYINQETKITVKAKLANRVLKTFENYIAFGPEIFYLFKCSTRTHRKVLKRAVKTTKLFPS